MSMASSPLVRNSRSSGRPMTKDVTGSSICGAGVHGRAPRTGAPPPSPRRCPRRPAQQPLSPLRRPVSPLRDRPPVALGQVTGQGTGILARLQPHLYPGEARPQQSQQFSVFLAHQPGAYPGGSSRLRSCCSHKHIIARRLPASTQIQPPRQVTTQMETAALASAFRLSSARAVSLT
jgi:hypothetical protein